MKICLVTHSYPRFPGDWRSNFIESLARAYARCGAEVTVLVPSTPGWEREPQEESGVRLVSYRYLPFVSWETVGYGRSMRSDLSINPLDMLVAPFLLAAGTVRCALLLRSEKFDLVQAHWAVPNALIAVAARYVTRSRAKVFTSVPGSDVTVLHRLGWLGKAMARVIGRSDYVSCNSADLKEGLVDAGLDGNRVDLVIYGADEGAVGYSEEGRQRLRHAWGAAEGDLVLLVVGRFVPKKGFASAFRALRHIVEAGGAVKLVAVGSGPLRGEYEEILRSDRTGPYARFVGEIPPGELGEHYSACDIFLMPSRRLPADGLNVVVPEAMACGRPVVASRVGGNDLVVAHGENGLLHDEGDARQLADHVLTLARDPALRERMGRAARDRARERHTSTAVARAFLDRYRSLAAPGHA